jgi:hypothetical protein
MLQRFLSPPDAERAERTLHRLASHDIREWALTGGMAAEIHQLRLGRQPSWRVLNDIDFVTDSFDSIPATLADDFLFRHVHPFDAPGKTLLQMVDPETAVRIDVFRACGRTMDRLIALEILSNSFRLISLEDLLARMARLTMDLAERVTTPAKYATDFSRLTELASPERVEAAWMDHRKPRHPASFPEARRQLEALIPAHPELLIDSDYSHDLDALCSRCVPGSVFQLADPRAVLTLLGYC